MVKVKNENNAIRNRITEFWQATHFSTKNPINKFKSAMNNRRLLIAAVFHFVRLVAKRQLNTSQVDASETLSASALKVNNFQDAA